jgi:transcription elongation GreA/GreB family factor
MPPRLYRAHKLPIRLQTVKPPVAPMCCQCVGSGYIRAPDMKEEIVELIRAELRARLNRLAKAAMDAHAAATDPGSKAESKYDTRNLEESYLATGQARHVKELGETLRTFENLRLRDFSKSEEIAAGALVEVERDGAKLLFLLAPSSGGLEIEFKGREITLLSPESPLYQNLVGKRSGDSLDAPPFAILAVS